MDSIDKNDMVMINSMTSCDDDERPYVSREDSVTVVYKDGDLPSLLDVELGSLSIICEKSGPPLEQRDDIVATKAIPTRLKEILNFNDEVKLLEKEEQMKARENMDRDMEGNIENIKKIEAIESLEDPLLLEAAKFAREKMSDVREKAKRGKTTLMHAVEVISVAFPPFVTSCGKSYEKNDLSEEVDKESQLYEQCMMEKKKAGLNFGLMEEKAVESHQHLKNCIAHAQSDEERVEEKQRVEIGEDRVQSCMTAKKEMEDIILAVLDDVHACLTSCKADIHNIENIQGEQAERFTNACRRHDKNAKALDLKLTMNKQNQDELRKKLESLEKQEQQLIERRKFEQQVQVKSNEWNDKITNQLAELMSSISNIQVCATTSLDVMELMKDAGCRLLNSSMNAEKQYLGHLKDLDIEAKTKWRNALATNAVECKLTIENARTNAEEYKENYKGMKEDLVKAVQGNSRLKAEKLKSQMKEYKDEVKKEDKNKKQAEDELTKLMESIAICDEKLIGLGRKVHTIDELFQWRQQEDAAAASQGSFPSIEFSENEESEDEI